MPDVNSQNSKRDVPYSFKLPLALREEVKRLSKKDGKSVTDVIVESLQKYVLVRVAEEMYDELDRFKAPALKDINTWQEFTTKKGFEYLERIREVRRAVIAAQNVLIGDSRAFENFFKTLSQLERLITDQEKSQLKRMGLPKKSTKARRSEK